MRKAVMPLMAVFWLISAKTWLDFARIKIFR